MSNMAHRRTNQTKGRNGDSSTSTQSCAFCGGGLKEILNRLITVGRGSETRNVLFYKARKTAFLGRIIECYGM